MWEGNVEVKARLREEREGHRVMEHGRRIRCYSVRWSVLRLKNHFRS